MFTDAGFSTLNYARSAEATIVVAGKEMTRDGSIVCKGSPIDFYSREIGRVVRSTIAAEACASANGIEVGLWHHAMLTELCTGVTVDLRPKQGDTSPLRNPFVAYRTPEAQQQLSATSSATENECSWISCKFAPLCSEFLSSGSAAVVCAEHGTKINGGVIYQCAPQESLAQLNPGQEDGEPKLPSVDFLSEADCIRPETRQWAPMTLIKVIALSDCANVFAAVSNLQPRSVDKLTNLSLRFIRDLSQQIHFSFLDAIYNIADTSTKISGNRRLYYLICESRRFVLSFSVESSLRMIVRRASRRMRWGNKHFLPVSIFRNCSFSENEIYFSQFY